MFSSTRTIIMKSRFSALVFLQILIALAHLGLAQATLNLILPAYYNLGPNTNKGLTATQLCMSYARVENNTATAVAGAHLDLYATPGTYATSTQGQRFLLGSHPLPTVPGSGYLTAGVDLKESFAQPPNGSYTVTMLLVVGTGSGAVVHSWYQMTMPADFGQVYLDGNAGWSQSGTTVRLQVGRIVNMSSGGSSNSMRVELWATPQPYAGVTQSNSYKLGQTTTFSPLQAGYEYNPVDQTVTYTAPPAGTYYTTLLLTEQYGTAWNYLHHLNMDTTSTFGTPAATVAAPTITPNGGTFSGSVEVSLACATTGASIRYTTNGDTVTPTSPLYVANTPVVLTTSGTVKAQAFTTGGSSTVTSATFVVTAAQVATPTATLANSPGFTQVSLACATAGATILYTTNGTTPVAGGVSTLTYNSAAPFLLTTNATVKAIATKLNWTTSAVLTQAVTVTPVSTVATPTILPNGGTFQGYVDVALDCATADAEIRYTTNGTAVTNSSPLYTRNTTFRLTANATVRTQAFKTGATSSAAASASFIVVPATVATPTASLVSTPGSVQVTLACATALAEIYYTTDGSTPVSAGAGSVHYTGPFTLTTSATVKALASKDQWTTSGILTQSVTVTPVATVAMPVIAPGAGSYSGYVDVTLTCATAGAEMHYTTNGDTVTLASPLYQNAAFRLTSSNTVKAQAFKNGMTSSPVATAAFVVTPATVVIPYIAVVLVPGASTVTLTCATPSAAIYYTTDGSTPVVTPTELYTSPFTLTVNRTVKAMAVKDGWTNSPVNEIGVSVLPVQGAQADGAWEVREMVPSSGTIASLADAEAILANPGNAAVFTYQSRVINRTDPDAPGGGGFFDGDEPFACDNNTPNAYYDDDEEFLLSARCQIVITAEDDYTFGFSSDDGARLRITGATFSSSTRLNPANPANPAHSGNTLSFANPTGNSDTLGVCHLVPGTYLLEFLTWEYSGGAYCEVFAARGAKTAVDDSFRLIGHVPSGMAGNGSRLEAPGWEVVTVADGANSLTAAIAQVYQKWVSGTVVNGLTFTSADDFPERDPMTFVLEGTNGPPTIGPWKRIASGATGLTTNRLETATPFKFKNNTAYASYRLTFPRVRSTAFTNSMQIAEVELLNAAGVDVTSPTDAVIPSSANSPKAETADNAISNTYKDKYLNFDRENSGFIVTPGARAYATINFSDPESGGGGHGFPQVPFPGNTAANDDNFAMGARASLVITTPGDYTFCLLNDDGARLRILGTSGWTVSSPNPYQSSPQVLPDGIQANGWGADVFGTVNLAAGTYPMELMYNEIGGDALIGVWGAYGRHTIFSPLVFSLVGANSGTSVPDSAPFALKTPSLATPPLNNNFSAAFPIPGGTASVAGSNVGATMETGEPGASGTVYGSVWWQWTAPATQYVQLDTIGSDFDTILIVSTGAPVNNLAIQGLSDNAGGNNTSKLKFYATAGTTYRFQVGGATPAAEGHVLLHLSPMPGPPVNDALAGATNLGGPVATALTGSTVGATNEISEPDHSPTILGAGGASVWYNWTAPYSGNWVLNTAGSHFDTTLAVYTGTQMSQLTRAAVSTQAGSASDPSRLILTAIGGITYHIAIDGAATGNSGDYALTLVPIPVVTSYSVATGSTRAFSLNWRSEPQTTYRVEQSSDLDLWSTVAAGVASQGTETGVNLTGIPLSAPSMFFRVQRE